MVGGFEVPIDVPEQRVPGSLLGGVAGFDVPVPIDVDLSAETASHNTGPVRAVHLEALTLAITPTAEPSGDSDDFSFVDSASLFVESTRSDTSLPRLHLGDLANVPPGARSVSFAVDSSLNLLPYVQEGARLSSHAQGRAPADDVTFDGRVVLSVEVF